MHDVAEGFALSGDAAESDLAHAGVDHLRTAGSRPVPPAVTVRAEERAPLMTLRGMRNFVWLPYYPLWALVIIALNLTAIWGITRLRPPDHMTLR